jgi:D-alanyl-D-alanine carboxypeptidase/D-alanyl-D-alanine-endopeptidase (penicillin-binding protein 4)
VKREHRQGFIFCTSSPLFSIFAHMKHLLYKKLTVLQVIAIFFILFTLLYFSFFFYLAKPGPQENISEKKDSSGTQTELKTEVPLKKDTTSFDRLKIALDTLAAKSELLHSGFGFCLMSPDSNKVLLEYNSRQSLVPASVMKTVTTGVALGKLGSGFRYVTRLQYDGEISNRVLNGNIYILGSGDPSLASDVFRQNATEELMREWVGAIKNLGIDSVRGMILGDAGIFEPDLIPAGWSWEDIQNDYGVGPCGLSFRENMYDIDLIAGNKGLFVKVSPPVPGLKLHNQVLVNKVAKPYVYVMGGPYQDERVMCGEVNGSYECRSAAPDPALYCAYTLMKSLQKNKVEVKDSCGTVRQLRLENKYNKKERKTFHSTYSPSLSQLVYHTNQVSQNFYAETFLRTLGFFDSNFGSTFAGTSAVAKFFREHNIDLHGFYMVDGSGVSRYDAISTKFLCDMLTMYSKDSSIFHSFYHSLPVSGISGTLRNIADDSTSSGKIHAKSGYMTRVRSYAGYVTTKSGKMLVFAMIMNNQEWDATETRDRLEQLMKLMTELD